MPEVTIHLGLTLPGPEQYSSVRADIEFGKIDTDGDVEAQIEQCTKITQQVAEAAESSLAQNFANTSNLNVEGVGLAGEFETFRDKMRKWAKEVTKDLKKLKDDS